MKLVKKLSLFTAVCCGLISSAQKIEKVPEFKNDIIVVKTYEQTLSGNSLEISDGTEISYYTELPAVRERNLAATTKILAMVFNELKKQQYKLVTSNSAGPGGPGILVLTTYVFQKE